MQEFNQIISKLIHSSYLRENTAFVMLQEAVHLLTGMIQVWALAHWLPREDYGVWGYCASLAGIACIFTLPGVTQAITFGAGHAEDGALWAGTKIRLRFGVLSSLTLLAMAVFHFTLNRTEAAYLLGVMSLFIPAQQAFESVDAYLMGSGNFRAVFFRRLTIQVTLAGTTSATAWATHSILACGIMLFGVGFMSNALLFILIHRRRRNDICPREFSKMIRRFTGQSVGSTISRSMERPLLSCFVSFSDLAAYNLALATLVPVGFGRLIDRILFSRLARSENAISVSTVLKGSWLIFLIGWPVYIVCAIGVYAAVTFLLPRYQDGIHLATILLLQIPFAWASKPGISLFLARRDCHQIYHRIIWGIICGRLVLLLVGVLMAGMVGAAWAWVAIEAITYVAVMLIMKKLARAAENPQILIPTIQKAWD